MITRALNYTENDEPRLPRSGSFGLLRTSNPSLPFRLTDETVRIEVAPCYSLFPTLCETFFSPITGERVSRLLVLYLFIHVFKNPFQALESPSSRVMFIFVESDFEGLKTRWFFVCATWFYFIFWYLFSTTIWSVHGEEIASYILKTCWFLEI